MWRLAPTLVSALGAAVYLVLAPRSPDLAAHVFRSELFGREGFTIWNGQWYGGHHTPAYSVLSPPLGWLLGPQLVGAVSAVAATACFEAIAHRHWGSSRARWGALWFGLASVTLLFTARLAFALGVGFGLGALLALQRRRGGLAVALAVLSALSSPVAGLFVSLCGAAVALGTSRRRPGAALAAAGLAPNLLLSFAFPEGGYAPFPLGVFLPILVACAVATALLWHRERTLAWGAALYGVGTTLAFLVPTAMGGNAERLGELAAGPVLVCAVGVRGRRVAAFAALLLALGAWQWYPSVRDIRKGATDPTLARSSYYRPLVRRLRAEHHVQRVDALFSFGKLESAAVAREVPLARGWSRQLDTRFNGIFYGREPLTARTYRRWLVRNGVTQVAVPAARVDNTSIAERQLVVRGLPYLHLVWANRDWRLYRVLRPSSIVAPRGHADIRLAEMHSDRLVLRVRRPGTALVRVRWTPYWLAREACVRPAGDWTELRAARRGAVILSTRFGADRLIERRRRCDELAEATAASMAWHP